MHFRARAVLRETGYMRVFAMSSLRIAAVDRLISRANPLCHYNTRSRRARISYAACTRAGPGHRNRRHRQGRGSCDFIAPEEGFLNVCGLRREKKRGGVKRPRQANNSTEHGRARRGGPDQGQSSYLRLKNRRQLPAIVRHDLTSNRAHKSWFCGGRSETCRSRFKGKLSVSKDLRFALSICVFVIKLEFFF